MILSDRESKLALARGHIRITPLPDEDAWSANSVDLRLDGELSRWPSPPGGKEPLLIRPESDNFNVEKLIAEHGHTFKILPDGYIVEPWSFHLGWTFEKIQLPHTSRLAARVEGKSSLARLGFGVHVTAPTIHAGFGCTDDPSYEGTKIRLEIWNLGSVRVELRKGMRICQLIFEEVHGTPEKGYRGAYATQAPELPRPSRKAPRRRKK